MKARKIMLWFLCFALIFCIGCAKEEKRQAYIYFYFIPEFNINEFNEVQYAKENGFISVQNVQDTYLIATMSESRYNEFMEEKRQIAIDSINNCLCSYVTKIECNEDFTENTIYVKSETYKNTFDLTETSIIANANCFQAMFGIEPSCKITVIDCDTGEVVSSYTK